MQRFIQVEDFFRRLTKNVKDEKYTFRTGIKIRHFYECMKLSFTLEECGNVCIDILPRIEKTGLEFLVVINVENDAVQIKRHLEKQLEALLKELKERSDQLLEGIVAPKAKVMFFLLGEKVHLYVKS